MMTIASLPPQLETVIAGDGPDRSGLNHGTGTALAEDAVSVLMKQSLADMAGKEATVLTVDYVPGAASGPHVHPGPVFAYD